MITLDNYFAVNNKGLSQSKIKMYAMDPNYMYRACISGELVREGNKNFMIGSEVDSILTEMDKAQNTVVSVYDDFRTKEAREWKKGLEDQGKVVVSQKEYDKIMAIAIAVSETEVWKTVEKEFTMQEIIVQPDKHLGPNFDCLYGKLDAYRINKDGSCDLLDLKTSVTVDEGKFFYKAKDLGYFKQLKFYSELLLYKYPQIKSFNYWFMVAEKSEPYRVKLFKVPAYLVDAESNELVYLIESIAARNDWSKPCVAWTDAVTLCDPKRDYVDDDDNF